MVRLDKMIDDDDDNDYNADDDEDDDSVKGANFAC